MKTNSVLVRIAAVSALIGLQACDYTRAPHAQHDPLHNYKLGSIYDCAAVGQPDVRLNTENTPSAGFTCAHRSNITAMVADPEDLKRARTMTPADAAARQRVVDAYREGVDTSVAPQAKGSAELIE